MILRIVLSKALKSAYILSSSLQLRLYAKYYRFHNCMILPDVFEARVTSWEQKDRFFKDDGVYFLFSFVIFLPFAACIIFVCYVIGQHNHLKKLFKKSDHYSSHAALVCVGQTYSLFAGAYTAEKYYNHNNQTTK